MVVVVDVVVVVVVVDVVVVVVVVVGAAVVVVVPHQPVAPFEVVVVGAVDVEVVPMMTPADVPASEVPTSGVSSAVGQVIFFEEWFLLFGEFVFVEVVVTVIVAVIEFVATGGLRCVQYLGDLCCR